MDDTPRNFRADIGCEGKVAFAGHTEATKAAKRTRRHKDDARVGPYRCTLCHRWHVGTHEWARDNDKRARARANHFNDSEMRGN